MFSPLFNADSKLESPKTFNKSICFGLKAKTLAQLLGEVIDAEICATIPHSTGLSHTGYVLYIER